MLHYFIQSTLKPSTDCLNAMKENMDLRSWTLNSLKGRKQTNNSKLTHALVPTYFVVPLTHTSSGVHRYSTEQRVQTPNLVRRPSGQHPKLWTFSNTYTRKSCN